VTFPEPTACQSWRQFQRQSHTPFSKLIALILGFWAIQQILQNKLSLSSQNFALVNGEHIGLRTENEL
jgi:hypothetical protein